MKVRSHRDKPMTPKRSGALPIGGFDHCLGTKVDILPALKDGEDVNL